MKLLFFFFNMFVVLLQVGLEKKDFGHQMKKIPRALLLIMTLYNMSLIFTLCSTEFLLDMRCS